jgi:hypothetical protein
VEKSKRGDVGVSDLDHTRPNKKRFYNGMSDTGAERVKLGISWAGRKEKRIKRKKKHCSCKDL